MLFLLCLKAALVKSGFAGFRLSAPLPSGNLRPSNPGRAYLVKGVYKCDKGWLFGYWIFFGQTFKIFIKVSGSIAVFLIWM